MDLTNYSGFRVWGLGIVHVTITSDLKPSRFGSSFYISNLTPIFGVQG